MIKAIKGFDNIYFVDDNGNVYKKNRIMKPVNNGIGYMQIRLTKNKKRKSFYIHRLIWKTFKGKIPKGYEINHIDHNKSNNALNNLELVTHSQNLKKAFLNHGYFGFMKKYKNKLTLSQAKSTLLEGAETTGEVKPS